MVSVRRQRLKAIRAGVPVKKANAAKTQTELIKLMSDLSKDPHQKRDGTSE